VVACSKSGSHLILSMLLNLGRDATEDFDDVGHSKSAKEQLKDFYVGECPEALDQKKVQNDSKELKDITKTPASTNTVGVFSKVLQFLVPLVLLGVAFALRKYGKSEDKISKD
jgi:cytochrome b involved in lipid metabolism